MPSEGLTVQAQLSQLGQRLDKGFDEIKRMLSSFEERLRDLEKSEARDHTLIGTRLDAAWKMIDQHENDIKALTQLIQEQTQLIASIEMIGKWFIGIVTALIVALLVGVISGKIRLVFI